MASRQHLLASRSAVLVTVAAMALAALVGVVLATSVKLGVALLMAACFLPVALISVPLALSGWMVVAFLSRLPGFEAIPNRVLIVVVVCWIGALLTRRDRSEPVLASGRGMLSLVGLFIVWCALSLLWSPVPDAGVTTLKDLLYDVAVFVLVLGVLREPRHARWLAFAFVAGAALSVCVGIADGGLSSSGGSVDSATAAEGRFQGGAGDPNYLAAVLVPAIVLAAALGVRRQPLLRAGLAGVVGLLAIGLVATESRGGVISVAVVGLTALVLLRGQRRAVLGILALLAVVAGAWFAASPTAWERISELGADQGSGRTDIWTVATRVGAEHPIVGVGLSQFPEVSHSFVRMPGSLSYVAMIVDERIVVHNIYLQLWVENGIIGLLLFLGLAGGGLVCAWRAAALFDRLGDREMSALSRAALLALVGMLTASFFLSNVNDRRLWVLLAFGPALLGIAQRQAARRSAG